MKGKISKAAVIGISALLALLPAAPAKAMETRSSLDMMNAAQASGETTEALGHIPEPLDQSYYNYKGLQRRKFRAAKLPASYDLRQHGFTTTVKTQIPWGACWSFGTTASVEGSVLMQSANQGGEPQATPDFSERHLAWFAYQPQPNGEGISGGTGNGRFNLGGNRGMATALWSSWSGLEEEAKAPYLQGASQDWSLSEDQRYDSVIHVQNVDFLPGTARFADESKESGYSLDEDALGTIKQAIMDNGVVDVSYYADQSRPDQTSTNGTYINNSTYAQYTDEFLGQNHEVSIVGWDDGYSRENFLEGRRPEHDGAWIVKNSWGSGWGNSGYFYLSYYDQSVASFTSFHAELPDGEGKFCYDHNYQYDYLGLGSLISFVPNDTVTPQKVANVFTVNGSEELRAVSVVTADPGTNVDIEIYKITNDNNPQSGELVLQQKAVIPYGGYHTVELDAPIYLPAGEKFSVVETIKGASGYYLPVELGIPEGSGMTPTTAVADPGQSFVNQGWSWKDLASLRFGGLPNGNAMIKAFTVDEEMKGPCTKEPVISRIQKVTDHGIMLVQTEGQEYSIDGGRTWQADAAFAGLEPETAYEILTRIAETKECQASNPADPITVTTKQEAPQAPANLKLLKKADDSILVEAVDGQEYAIRKAGQGTEYQEWQDVGEFTGLLQETSYEIVTRMKETELAMPGIVSSPFKVSTKKSAPPAPPAPEILSVTSGSITVNAQESQEYTIDGGESWQSGGSFTGLTSGTEYHIFTRLMETEESMPGSISKEAAVRTKAFSTGAPAVCEPVGRSDVLLQVAEIPGQEYSIRVLGAAEDFTAWQDLAVFEGLSPKTSYEIVTRVKANQEHEASLVSEHLVMTTKGSAPPAPPAVLPVVRTDRRIEVQTAPGQEYSIDQGLTWQLGGVFENLEPDTEYEVLARIPETEETMGSGNGKAALIRTKQAASAAPDMPKMLKKTSDSIKVAAEPGLEYSIDGGKTWNAGGSYINLAVYSEYRIIARYAQTEQRMESASSAPLIVMTDKKSVPAPKAPVLQGKTGTTVTISTAAGQEYSIDGGKSWQTGGTFAGLKAGSAYQILARVKETATSKTSAPSQALTVATDKVQTYSISFQANGGKVSQKTKSISYGQSYGTLPSPQRVKYDFQGWYTKKRGGSKIAAAKKFSLKDNQTLYAHWKKTTVARVKTVKLSNLKTRRMYVKIKSVKGAAGYQIRLGTNASMTKGKKTLNVTSAKKIGGLKKGKTYYVKVRAYKKDSANRKIYGRYSKAGKLKIIR